MATPSILRNVDKEVLHEHLKKCVLGSFDHDDIDDKHKKIQEMIAVMETGELIV